MPAWNEFAYFKLYPAVFTPVACKEIIGYAKIWQSGALGSARNCTISWLSLTEETKWIFDALFNLAIRWNNNYNFKLNLDISVGLQLSRYQAGEKYDWHMDLGGGPMSRRKLSIVMPLQDAQNGGGFEIFPLGPIHMRPGDACLFPSFIMHRALPPSEGERISLAAWLLGDDPLA